MDRWRIALVIAVTAAGGALIAGGVYWGNWAAMGVIAAVIGLVFAVLVPVLPPTPVTSQPRSENSEERLAKVEAEVRIGPRVLSGTADMLREIPSLRWVEDRGPEVNASILKKIDDIVGFSQAVSPTKVIIVGEAGVGKTTLLYLVGLRLLSQGRKLFASSINGLDASSVLVTDDLLSQPQHGFLLGGTPSCTVIATARTFDWVNSSQLKKGWHEVNLSGSDFDEVTLKRVLGGLLKGKGLHASEDGIRVAVNRSEGIPLYLDALTTMVKSNKQELSRETAAEAPPYVSALIAEMLTHLARGNDGATLAAMFALASTPKLRLQREQLARVLSNLKLPTTFSLELLSRGPFYYSLPHDAYRDVLLHDWRTLGLNQTEPNLIQELRHKNFHEVIVSALKTWCIHDISDLDPYELAMGVRISLENDSNVAECLLENIVSGEGNLGRFSVVADVIAQDLPSAVVNAVRGRSPEELAKLEQRYRNAPHFMALLLRQALETISSGTVSGHVRTQRVAYLLNNLGICLRLTGRLQESFDTSRSAVEAWRDAVRECPDQKHLNDLARSLESHGDTLVILGRSRDALDAVSEGVDIRRKLAKSSPKDYLPLLASSLGNLGRLYEKAGENQKAISVTEESVQILSKSGMNLSPIDFRTLAADYANIATYLRKVGKPHEALASARKAVDTFRRLTRSDPSSHLPDLAISLSTLGTILDALGSTKEALVVASEAVETFRKVSLTNTNEHMGGFGAALNNLAAVQIAQGDFQAALATAKEAVLTYRKLSKMNPNAGQLGLKTSLTNLARVLEALGDATASKVAIEEAERSDIHGS